MGVTNTWIAAAAGDWSDDANWSLGHSPIEGEDPTFDGTSVNNCNANDPTPTGVLTIAAGYTGTITQSSDMHISGYSQAGGTFTGNTIKWIYCNGNFIKNGGTLTQDKICLDITNGTLKSNSPSTRLYSLKIHGSVVIDSNIHIYYSSSSLFELTPDSELIINEGYILVMYRKSYFYGIVKGLGTLYLCDFPLIIQNNFEINVTFFADSGNSETKKFNTDVVINGSVTIKHNIADKLLTIDLNGYNFSSLSIIVDLRGILQCGEGTITTSSLDSSAGTIIPETACWVFDGAATVNVAAGQKLHSVIVKDRLKLLSDLGVEQALAHTNPIDLNGFALTLDRPENEYTSIRRPIVRAIRKVDIGAVGLAEAWLEDVGAVI